MPARLRILAVASTNQAPLGALVPISVQVMNVGDAPATNVYVHTPTGDRLIGTVAPGTISPPIEHSVIVGVGAPGGQAIAFVEVFMDGTPATGIILSFATAPIAAPAPPAGGLPPAVPPPTPAGLGGALLPVAILGGGLLLLILASGRR